MIEIEVLILHNRGDAILVAEDEDDVGVWLYTEDIIEMDPEDATKGDMCMITITEKLAIRKGLM